MSYRVRITDSARRDLIRLYEFQLQRAIEVAQRAEQAILKSLQSLEDFPFANRKIDAENPFLRELLISFGSAGSIALFEIINDTEVVVLALRHQLEEDYH